MGFSFKINKQMNSLHRRHVPAGAVDYNFNFDRQEDSDSDSDSNNDDATKAHPAMQLLAGKKRKKKRVGYGSDSDEEDEDDEDEEAERVAVAAPSLQQNPYVAHVPIGERNVRKLAPPQSVRHSRYMSRQDVADAAEVHNVTDYALDADGNEVLMYDGGTRLENATSVKHASRGAMAADVNIEDEASDVEAEKDDAGVFQGQIPEKVLPITEEDLHVFKLLYGADTDDFSAAVAAHNARVQAWEDYECELNAFKAGKTRRTELMKKRGEEYDARQKMDISRPLTHVMAPQLADVYKRNLQKAQEDFETASKAVSDKGISENHSLVQLTQPGSPLYQKAEALQRAAWFAAHLVDAGELDVKSVARIFNHPRLQSYLLHPSANSDKGIKRRPVLLASPGLSEEYRPQTEQHDKVRDIMLFLNRHPQFQHVLKDRKVHIPRKDTVTALAKGATVKVTGKPMPIGTFKNMSDQPIVYRQLPNGKVVAFRGNMKTGIKEMEPKDGVWPPNGLPYVPYRKS